MGLKSSLDIIDVMGFDATREDYEWLAKEAQRLADDPEFWTDDEEQGETT